MRTLKRISIAILLLFVAYGMVACGTHSESKEVTGGKQAKETKLTFDMIDEWDAAQEVAEKVEQVREKEAFEVITIGEDTFIVITMGEQNSGGYVVHIHEVIDTGASIKVLYEFESPAADAMVTQAITYPVAIAKINKTDKPIHFEASEQTKE